MPWLDGKRVSVQVWLAKNSRTEPFPASGGPDTAAVESDTEAPTAEAGRRRSPRSEQAARAAIADALGLKDLPDDIDVSGNPED